MPRPTKTPKGTSTQPSILSALGKKLSVGSNKEIKIEQDQNERSNDDFSIAESAPSSKTSVDSSGDKSVSEDPTVMEDDATSRKRPRRRAAAQRKPIVDFEAIDIDDDDDDEFVLPDIQEDEDEEDVVDDDGDPSEIEEIDSYSPPPTKKPKSTTRATKEKKVTKSRKSKVEKEELIPTFPESFLGGGDEYENTLLHTVKNPFYNYIEANNSNSRKISNNIKDKMIHLFGLDQKRLTAILKLQENLYHNILHLSLDQMIKLDLNEITTELHFDDDTLLELSFEEFDTKFPLRNNAKIRFNKDEQISELVPGAVTYLPTISSSNPRQGFVLNTGALPVDMSWNIQTNKENEVNPNIQYLAISIADTFNVTDSRFSAFLSGKTIKGVNGLQIYQINTETFQMNLVRSYISDNGVMSNIKWIPTNNNEKGVIGVIGAVFGDGKIRFLKVQGKNSVVFCSIVSASKTIEVPDTRITSFDLISNESIVFGTQNGFIGEYDLKNDSISYVYPLLTQGITKIASNYSDYYYDNNPVYVNGEYQLKTKSVFVGSIDLQLFVDLNDIPNQVSECFRTKTLISQCSYIPLMHLFGINDGSRTTKVFSKRDSLIATNILKNEGVSSSLATSRLHPIVMAGSSDGELFIADSIRRMLTNRKSPLNLNFPMARVLKLEYSSSQDCYRLVTNHLTESVSMKEVDKDFTFNAPNVCIQSMSWNENKRSGNWYAASSIGGLIFIEKLPSFTAVKHYNGEE